MVLPNFLLIGAAKSGTSALYNYLGQHPEIYLSPIKGPCFFAFEDGEKVRFSGPGDQSYYDRNVITDLNGYLSLFDSVKNEVAIGEGSVLYLDTPAAPRRIKRYIPDVKLIAVLRNPVDRAFSSFLHLRRNGREPLADFAEALRAEETRIKSNWQHLWHYKRLGFYYVHLKRYYDLFHPSQIAVYTYDAFRDHPIEVLQAIFRFLDVGSTFVPDTAIRYNVSGTPKLRALHTFLNKRSIAKTILKSLLPGRLRQRVSHAARQWNLNPAKAELTEETKRHLVALYRDDILKLQSLIQRDLSSWLTL